MTTASSCSVGELHVDGTAIAMLPYGSEGRRWGSSGRCGDCGVVRGGFHHLGCDIQCCPACRGQMLSCGCHFDEDEGTIDWGVDGNGDPVEIVMIDGEEVIVHHTDSLPPHDITEVRGIPCTTPVRTVIDLAPEVDRDELDHMVEHFLDRGLMTVDEAWARLAEDDMADRRGAALLREVLLDPDGPAQ
jgi:hypothetical protein